MDIEEAHSLTETRFSASLKFITGVAGIYAVGDVLVKGLNYLFLPIYAQYLSPAEYGLISIHDAIRMIAGILISFGLIGAILRFVHVVQDQKDFRELFGAMWMFLVIVPGLICLFLLTFLNNERLVLFRTISFDPFIKYTLIIAYLSTAFILLPSTLFRAQQQARQYVLLGLFGAIATIVSILIFIVVRNEGAYGWIKGMVVGAGITSLVSILILLRLVKPNFSFNLLRPALVFSIPLMPHFMAQWILNVSDRMILERFVELPILGVYTLGYQFGLAYQVILIGINNALIPQYGKATKRTDEFELLRRMNTFYVLAILIIGLFISLLGKDVVTTLFPSEYHSAMAYIPWVVLGYLSVGLYFIPTNFLTVGLGRSRGIAIASITAATFNVALNLILIPRFGAIAAAVNTAIAYSLLAVIVYLLARQQGELPVERSRIGKLLITFAVIFILGSILLNFTPVINLLLFAAMLISSLIPLTLMKFWTNEEKDWFRHQISTIR